MIPFLPFLSIAGDFIKRFWPYILVGIVILSIFFHWRHLVNSIDDLKKEKVELVRTVEIRTQERDLWIGNYKDLSGAVQANNQAIQALGVQANTIVAGMTALGKQVGQSTTAAATRLGAIKQQDTSNLTDKQAVDYLRKAAEDFKK